MSLPLPKAKWLGDIPGHTDAVLQDYGQACREAALEEANKREPLSELQLFVLWHALPDDDGAFPDFLDAARAVEQAHHITEKALKP